MNIDFNLIIDVLSQFGQLLGVAALVAAIVNVFKTLGFIPDGSAGKWSAALNLVALVVLVAFKLYMPAFDLFAADATAAEYSKYLILVFGYLIQLRGSLSAHNLLSDLKIPYIGKYNKNFDL